jgi:hypothetical protein
MANKKHKHARQGCTRRAHEKQAKDKRNDTTVNTKKLAKHMRTLKSDHGTQRGGLSKSKKEKNKKEKCTPLH